MFPDREIQDTSCEVPNVNGIESMQQQDTPAYYIQPELQPTVHINPAIQSNNETWNDSQQQQNDYSESIQNLGIPAHDATSNTQYPSVNSPNDHDTIYTTPIDGLSLEAPTCTLPDSEQHYVPNQNTDTTTGINSLQPQDISASHIQPEPSCALPSFGDTFLLQKFGFSSFDVSSATITTLAQETSHILTTNTLPSSVQLHVPCTTGINSLQQQYTSESYIQPELQSTVHNNPSIQSNNEIWNNWEQQQNDYSESIQNLGIQAHDATSNTQYASVNPTNNYNTIYITLADEPSSVLLTYTLPSSVQHHVPNQNSDTTTGINSLQPQDISASAELQSTVHNNPSIQSNNETWNDSQQQQNDINSLPSCELPPYADTNQNTTNTTPTGETLPLLTVIKQPSKLYRFRYKSEVQTESHGYLLGRGSAGRNLRTFITLELRMPPHVQDEEYFIRCTLHQPVERSLISPHKLCRRKNNILCACEDELIPMRRVGPHCYQFKLEKFLISRAIQNEYDTNCREKYQSLHERHDSQLRLVMPTDNQRREQQAVQIGFEAFKHAQNEGYTHVTGPIFSDCITDGKPLKITRICNLHGGINGGTEVNLIVTGYNPNITTSIEIDDTLGWHRSLVVDRTMLIDSKTIAFRTPRYDNERNQNERLIECEIRLKREMYDEISSHRSFTYVRTLKRSFDEMNQINAPPSTSDHAQSINYGNLEEYDTDSAAAFANESCEVIKGQEPSLSSEPMNSPTILDKTLQEICFIHKKAENACSEEKLEYFTLVRQHFNYYIQQSPSENSILHDTLENDKYQRYEMKLYKIIQHFELKDLIRNSKNIYGETPLMSACIFNKPQLIRALINMECPIQARKYEDGNNVLHLISQHQSTVECQRNVLEAIKTSQNKIVIAGFIEAMKNFNLNGMTPLHVAVMYDNVKLVNEFLRLCKRHNALNDVISCGKQSDGNTILHQAVLHKSEDMYSRILKYIPDAEILNVENFAGITAAEMKQNMEINRLVDSMEDIILNGS